MKELLVASGNKGKLREFGELLQGVVETILSPADFPGLPEVEEDGETFEANAIKKARSAALFTGRPVLADDSGLCVDHLDGRPGVYSARFAGEGAGDAANNARLLRELAGVPRENRGGEFHCVIALCHPGAARGGGIRVRPALPGPRVRADLLRATQRDQERHQPSRQGHAAAERGIGERQGLGDRGNQGLGASKNY